MSPKTSAVIRLDTAKDIMPLQRIYGYQPSNTPAPCGAFRARPYPGDTSPAVAFSKRAMCLAAGIRDQADSEACVGEGLARAAHLASGGTGLFPSSLMTWAGARANERARVGAALTNVGCRPADAIAFLLQYGFVPEAEWPLDAAKYDEELPLDVLQDAAPLAPDGVAQVATWGAARIADMKAAVIAGACIFATEVDQRFENIADASTWTGLTGPSLGGHCMCVIGWDDERAAFEVVNSWGTSWGDGGFCWIGYPYMALPLVKDVFAVTKAPVLS